MQNLVKIKTFSDIRGDLSFIQNSKKFNFSRVYYIYNIKNKTIRGEHYHKNNRQMIICLKGKIILNIANVSKNNKKDPLSRKRKVLLNDPTKSFTIENYQWHSMVCYKNSILLILAETKFSRKDYFYI